MDGGRRANEDHRIGKGHSKGKGNGVDQGQRTDEEHLEGGTERGEQLQGQYQYQRVWKG